MSDLYLNRLVRVCPPRAGATRGPGSVRVQSVTGTSANYELDNDVLQYTSASTQGPAGTLGRAMLRIHAESNDVYFLTGAANTVTANSAATSGNTMCWRCPKDQERDYEFDPNVDKFVAFVTLNGGGLTATVRYCVVSFPVNANP